MANAHYCKWNELKMGTTYDCPECRAPQTEVDVEMLIQNTAKELHISVVDARYVIQHILKSHTLTRK